MSTESRVPESRPLTYTIRFRGRHESLFTSVQALELGSPRIAVIDYFSRSFAGDAVAQRHRQSDR